MGNRAGSIPALGTSKVARLSGFALQIEAARTFSSNLRKQSKTWFTSVGYAEGRKKYNKGQAGDLNIRYHSEQAKCPESK